MHPIAGPITFLMAALLALPMGPVPGDRPLEDLAKRLNAERAWFGGKPSLRFLEARARRAEEAQALVAIQRSRFTAAGVTAPRWVPLGPFDTSSEPNSGRPTAVVPDPGDPRLVYLATSGGGVWKCENADQDPSTWDFRCVSDGWPAGNQAVGALALNPVDHRIVYAGLGDAFEAEGLGLFVSLDGGSNWSRGGTLGNASRTLSILPLDGDTLLVGTNAGLFRSTDRGRSFSLVSVGIEPPAWIWEVRPLGTTLILSRHRVIEETEHGPVARNEGGQNHVGELPGPGDLWYSVDKGLSWQLATLDSRAAALGLGRLSLATSPASSTRAWGLGQTGDTIAKGILATSDGGRTWAYQPSSSLFSMSGDNQYNGWYSQLLIADPDQPGVLFAGAVASVYRSGDGGATWQPITNLGQAYDHVDYHGGAWTTFHGKKALFVLNDGGLSLLADPLRSSPPNIRDRSFLDNRMNTPLATLLVTHLGSTTAPTPPDSRFRISLGCQDNGSFVRLANGQDLASSTTFDFAAGGDGFGTLMHARDGNKILVSSQYNYLSRSVNGGLGFLDTAPGLPQNNVPFHTRLIQGNADSSGETIYAIGNSTVYASANFGQSWAAVNRTGLPPGTPIRNVGTSFLNPSTLAVVCNGGVGFIRGGSAWQAFGAIPGQADSLSSIAFDPRDDRTLYMGSVALNPDAHHLWKTRDGGTTWTVADGSSSVSNGLPFGLPVHLVQVDRLDSRVVYAGTDFGLYRSVDAGTSWSRYGEGLPWVAVRDLFEAEDGSFLRVATYGRGVWELSLTYSVQSLRVTPATVTLKAGQSQTFSASVTGSGELLSFSNWSSSGGNITTRGIFTGTLPGHFTVTATSLLDPSRNDSASVTVTIQPDLNLDGRVDVLDLAELARSFGTHPTSAGYVYLSDQNGDGEINDLDVVLWFQVFGN